MKTDNELWRLIESANWESDHDYERIYEYYKNSLNEEELKELEQFARDKGADLYENKPLWENTVLASAGKEH